MKYFLIAAFVLVFVACEGPTGPAGPRGVVDVQTISGVIAHHFYDGDTLTIGTVFVQSWDIVSLVVKPEPESPWIVVPEIMVSDWRVRVCDPTRRWLGYEYELRIINLPQP